MFHVKLSMDFEKIKKLIEKEGRLINLTEAEKIIFVGDTHGDLEASQKIIKNYLEKENKIVFLGDYVDRGENSKENLDFLLETKIKFPDRIYLLQGNHEGYSILNFTPAEFWENLSNEDYQKYSSLVKKFPLVIVAKEIIALHGVFPEVSSLEEINKIKLGSEKWFQITWGDLSEKSGEYLGINPYTGRPQFGKDYFFKMLERFNKKILIRSHQIDLPLLTFDNKCLTLFTSSAYKKERTIAIFNFKKPIKTAKDLEIIRI